MPVHFPEWGLTSEVRHNLFLAFKEALHNVVKHAAASEVSIRLVVGEAFFELEVEDNGAGFSPVKNAPEFLREPEPAVFGQRPGETWCDG